MFPQDGLDWPPEQGALPVTARAGAPRIAYCLGRAAIGQMSPLTRATVWSFRYYSGMIIGKPGSGAEVDIESIPNIRNFDVCFDYEMRPVITYELNDGTCFFRYYDVNTSTYVTKQLPAGSRTPRCTFDLNGTTTQNQGEVLIAYFNSNNLFVLKESENYAVGNPNGTYLQELYLDQIGFSTTNNRLQFIVYQLMEPALVADAEPVPLSKYSLDIIPLTPDLIPPEYWPQDTPQSKVIQPELVTFTKDGLDLHIAIDDPNASPEDTRMTRYVPVGVCIRPEFWEGITDANAPMFTSTYRKVFPGHMDPEIYPVTKASLSSNVVYSDKLKMYIAIQPVSVTGQYNNDYELSVLTNSTTGEVSRMSARYNVILPGGGGGEIPIGCEGAIDTMKATLFTDGGYYDFFINGVMYDGAKQIFRNNTFRNYLSTLNVQLNAYDENGVLQQMDGNGRYNNAAIAEFINYSDQYVKFEIALIDASSPNQFLAPINDSAVWDEAAGILSFCLAPYSGGGSQPL